MPAPDDTQACRLRARGAPAFQVEAVQPNSGGPFRRRSLRFGSVLARYADSPGRETTPSRPRPGFRSRSARVGARAPGGGSAGRGPNGAVFPPAVGDGPRAGAERLAGSHTEPRAAAPTQQPTAADSRALTTHTPTRDTRTARAHRRP